MVSTTRASLPRLLACAAIPMATLAGLAAACRGVAPLWAGGSTDPSYEYLLNGLLLAEGHVPVKTDHPGITVEVVGALTLRLRHALGGGALPLRDHVLTDPEPFLAATVLALLLVFAASATFLGWAAWRLTGLWWLAALAQASPFVCFEVLRSLVQVMCEPLLLACATTLSGLLLLALVADRDPSGLSLEARMGAVLGLGLATKLVFLPAALPPLLVARGRAGRLRILAWTALAAGACLLVIAPRVPATADWMWRLLTHAGYHGSGAVTVIDPSRYPAGIWRLLLAELPLHAALVACSVVCLWRHPPGAFAPNARRCALGLLGTWALTLAAAAKQPQAHYLVTVAGLLPCALVLALWRLHLGGRGPRVLAARAAVAVTLLLGAAQGVRSAAWFLRMRSEVKAGATSVGRAAQGRAFAQGHRVSTVAASLAAGNEWTGLAFSADLRRLYPEFLAYDCEGFHAFGEDATPDALRALVGTDGTARLQDAVWRRLTDCPWTSALSPRTVAAGGRDALHEARILPPPGEPSGGPWLGGMLVVAGMDAGAGPQRWATAPTTAILFQATGGPLSLEVAAGHSLPGRQGLTVSVNGRRVDARDLPRLPATERYTLPIDARTGWNEIAIVYDAVAPAAPRLESPLLGFRARARSAETPFVFFEVLRLVPRA